MRGEKRDDFGLKTGCDYIRSMKELMDGKGIERPSNVAATDETFKKAPKAKA